ncbi:MAG: radical SAM protein [Candidatus Korarchaeum sp.]
MSVGRTTRVRASIGTLVKAGVLERVKTREHPRTAYILISGRCLGSCLFCPQWLNSEKLSRVSWPEVALSTVLEAQRNFERICIQSILKKMFWKDLIEVASLFEVPVSIATNPMGNKELSELRRVSQMLGIGLDAMSRRVFEEMRKPGSFDQYMRFIEKSIEVYGDGNVYVHAIAGLGESPEEALRTISYVHERGGGIALFAFTPVPGTPLQDEARPPVGYYRFLQVVTYSLRNGIPLREIKSMDPDDYKEAFLTSGCPSCNRPFYNESPAGDYYNFPSLELLERNWDKVRKELEVAVDYFRLLP